MRSPSESERGAILGGPDDPRANGARAHASEAAYDLNEDPAARNHPSLGSDTGARPRWISYSRLTD